MESLHFDDNFAETWQHTVSTPPHMQDTKVQGETLKLASIIAASNWLT